MGAADIAKAGLAKALEVYEGLAKLAGVVDQIDRRLVDFRDETRKRVADFEARTDSKIANSESRIERRIDDLEKRMRELESRAAQLDGKVSAALSEAYKSILAKAVSEPLGTPLKLEDGQNKSKKEG